MPIIRITVDGKLALTVEQAATRYGLAHSTVSSAITRHRIEPDAVLDGRKKLYLAARLDKLMKERPGRGANLRGHG